MFADVASQIKSFLVNVLDALDVIRFVLHIKVALWKPKRTRQMHPDAITMSFDDIFGFQMLHHLKIVVQLIGKVVIVE